MYFETNASAKQIAARAIKREFEKSKMTQEAFGKKVGLPQSRVSEILNGKIEKMGMKALGRILTFFELGMAENHFIIEPVQGTFKVVRLDSWEDVDALPTDEPIIVTHRVGTLKEFVAERIRERRESVQVHEGLYPAFRMDGIDATESPEMIEELCLARAKAFAAMVFSRMTPIGYMIGTPAFVKDTFRKAGHPELNATIANITRKFELSN